MTFKTGTKGGKREKTITVTTNDPEQKTVKLKVRADVQVVLSTKPSRINFGRLKKGDTATKYVSLIGSDKDVITSISAKSGNEHLKAETNISGYENDKDKKIKVTVNSDIKVGRFSDRININTDNKKVEKLVVYVYGEVEGNIKVIPNHLSFGLLEKGKVSERTIKLKAVSDAPFKILNVSSSLKEIETTVETIQEGKEYKIRAKITEGFNQDSLKGKLVIKTDDKDQENIEIRVFGRVKRSTQGPKKKKG